jgi:hypothetical protein
MIYFNYGYQAEFLLPDSPARPPEGDDYFIQCQTAGTVDGYILTADGDRLYTPRQGLGYLLCETTGTEDGYVLTSAGEQIFVN